MSFLLDDVQFIGRDLVRPECVLTTRNGNVYTADFRGGISHVSPSGGHSFYGGGAVGEIEQLKPNGICMLEDGSFLVAHLGEDIGGVFRVYRDNRIEPYLTEINGDAIPPSNFIYLDHQGRLWLTVSTRQIPRASAYRSDVADGFIAVIDEKGARIVADNIGYTNEVYVTEDGSTLYANATFTRETLAFDIGENNTLNQRKVVARYGKGIYPDGLTMDTDGYLWVSSIVSNSLVRLNPETGESELMLQDVDSEHLDRTEAAYRTHSLGRPHLDNVRSKKLKNISSLAFAGPNLNKVYLGCLLGDSVAYFESNFNGVKPAHWFFDDATSEVK